MKTRLNKLSSKVGLTLKDKRGFILIETMAYTILVVFITILLINVLSNVAEKYLSSKYQEEFYSQKNQLYTLISKDLIDVDSSTVDIVPSKSNSKNNKLVFKTNKYDIEIVQGEDNLFYKRTDKKTKELETFKFKYITSSDFNRIDNVCFGNDQPNDCYSITNTLDIVVRCELRIVRSAFSIKSGRVFYYE